MELFSKEVIEQIEWAKAQREAAKAVEPKAEAVEPKAEAVEPEEEYVNFRDLCNEVFDDEPDRGLFRASW